MHELFKQIQQYNDEQENHQQQSVEVPRGQLKKSLQNSNFQSYSERYLSNPKKSEELHTKKNIQKQGSYAASNFHSKALTVRRATVQPLIENQLLQRQVQSILKRQVQPDQTMHYVLQNLKYMLSKETRKIQSKTVQQGLTARKNCMRNALGTRFEAYILGIHQVCVHFGLQKTLFPACYFFYLIYSSKSLRDNQVQYAVVVSILSASKYHQIYPPYLQSIKELVNQTLSTRKILKLELQLLQLLNFQDFYSENQVAWVEILGLLLHFKQRQKNQVKYMLRIGLLSIDTFSIRPSLKAFAAIALYSRTMQEKYDLFFICQGILNIKDKQLEQTLNLYNFCLKYIDHLRIQINQFASHQSDSAFDEQRSQLDLLDCQSCRTLENDKKTCFCTKEYESDQAQDYSI